MTRAWLLGVLLGASALQGCKSQQVSKVPATLDLNLLSDAGVALDFDALLDGGLPFGSSPVLVPVLHTLTVSDLGGAGLTLSNVMVPDGGAFSIVGAVPGDVAGGGAFLAIQFLPTAQAAYSSSLTFDSTDPNHPTVAIALTGTGSTEGELTVVPDPVAFGQVGQGLTQLETVTLSSVGSAPLRVGAIALGAGSDPAYAIVSSVGAGGFTLSNQAPGNTLPLTLSFSPTAQTPAKPAGTLVIQSSDPTQTTLSVPLTGQTLFAPVPAITAPATAAVGAQVTLDGTASSDPNVPASLPLSYQWAITKEPLGSTARLSSLDAGAPTILLDGPGVYDFQLDVTNAAGITDVAPAHASISARPADDLYVELIWDNAPVDLDLHLLGPNATIGGAGDCNAYNPDAGFSCVPGSDHLTGPGPEFASIASPIAGNYTVVAILAQAHNAPTLTTNVTARIYVYGVLSSELNQPLDKLGEVWQAATIAWPSATITPVGIVTP